MCPIFSTFTSESFGNHWKINDARKNFANRFKGQNIRVLQQVERIRRKNERITILNSEMIMGGRKKGRNRQNVELLLNILEMHNILAKGPWNGDSHWKGTWPRKYAGISKKKREKKDAMDTIDKVEIWISARQQTLLVLLLVSVEFIYIVSIPRANNAVLRLMSQIFQEQKFLENPTSFVQHIVNNNLPDGYVYGNNVFQASSFTVFPIAKYDATCYRIGKTYE